MRVQRLHVEELPHVVHGLLEVVSKLLGAGAGTGPLAVHTPGDCGREGEKD